MAKSIADTVTEQIIDTGGTVVHWFSIHGMNIVIILLIAWFLHRFGANLLKRIITRTVRPDLYPTKADRQKRIKTLESLARAIVRTGVYLLAGILIIGELNPSYTAALFASAGLVTVALGFGAKDLINDFMSGIFIITENQYRVGDIVEIAGVSGTVEDVTVRTTVLRDLDGNVHHVPNGDITVTTNKTMGYSRLNEDISLTAHTDLERVENIINHIGKRLAAKAEFEDTIKEAPHFAGVVGYTQNGVVVKVAAKVTAGEKWNVKSAYYRMLHKEFIAQGIELSGPMLVPHGQTKTSPTKKPAK